MHLTLLGEAWLVGMLPASILCSARLEWERRTSDHEDERRFVRLPAVGGVTGGIFWPVVLAVLVVVYVVWLVGRSGRTIVELIEGTLGGGG